MKWIGKRISFEDNKAKTTIVIHAQDIGWVKAAMGAWVSMWMTIGAVIIWSYATLELSNQETIIIFVFLSFWAYYAFKITKSWSWLMWGKELIKIDEASLRYKKSIRGYGKSAPYLIDNISKISLHKPEEKSFQAAWEKSAWIVGGERIEFDYLGKIIKLGRKLDPKDAELLFKLLSKRIDTQVRANKKRQTNTES